MGNRPIVLGFFGALLGLIGIANAQTVATMEGNVRDMTGAPVAGARIEIAGAGTSRTVSSDTVGHYRVDGLVSGRYTVVVERPGFAPATRTVELSNVNRIVDLTLGSVINSESVTVTAIAPSATLDEPTETASRLGLTARETPATLNVVTFAEAQARGINTTVEALNRVPAVSSSLSPGQPGAFAIRGFSAGATSLSFNGTRISASTMVVRNQDSWSFDRIEILKGPASVLYGEGALAGAVNYVSKRPDFTTRRGEALISYGSLGTARAAAGAAGPLGSRAAYRADAVWSQREGYIDSNHFETLALTGALDFKLAPSVTVSTSVDHFHDTYDASYIGTPLLPRDLARQPTDLVADVDDFVFDKSLRTTNYNQEGAISGSDETWVRGKIEWRFSPSWKLLNEVYFHDAVRTFRRLDITFVPATAQLSRQTTNFLNDFLFYGNRVALSADTRIGDRRNRFTVGVEANRNDFFSPRRQGVTSSVAPFNPVRGVFSGADTAQNYSRTREDFDTTIDLVSVFAENAFAVVPRVTLVAGGRYDRMDTERVVTSVATGAKTDFGITFTPLSGRAGIVVDVKPRTQFFGQYTTAVAPVATVLLLSQANAAFDLTTGASWEGGVKSTFFGSRVDATASLFTIEQENILTRDPNDPNLVVQGGTQRSSGVEFSASTEITPALRLDATAAIMDVRFGELIEAGGIDRSGNVPPDMPERTASLWVSYQIARLPLSVAGGLNYRGRVFTNNANSTRAAGYTILDAQVGWHLGPGDVTVRGKNLRNALYALSSSGGGRTLLLGAPRTVDVSYHFRF